MTEREIAIGTARLKKLEREQRLHADSLTELKRWWKRVVKQEQNKVVSLDDYRALKEMLK